MSDLLGGITDWVSSIYQNVTSGTLSDSQKNQIAIDATSQLITCQRDMGSSECQALLKKNKTTVEAAAPTEECALRIPVYGCFKDFAEITNAILIVGALIVGMYIFFVFLVPSYATTRG